MPRRFPTNTYDLDLTKIALIVSDYYYYYLTLPARFSDTRTMQRQVDASVVSLLRQFDWF